MSPEIRNLQDQHARLMAEARTILSNGALTSESRERYDRITRDLEAVLGDIQRREAFEKIEAEQRGEVVTRFRPNPGDYPGGPNESNDPVERNAVRDQKEKRAFREYLRSGVVDQTYLRGMENRAGLTTTGTVTNPVAVPIAFNPQVVEAQLSYGELYNIVEVLKTDSGEPLKYVLDDDTSNGLSEVTIGTDATDTPPTLSGSVLYVDNFTAGLVKVDMGLLNDSGFDLDSFIRDKFAKRFYRGASSLIYSGNATGGNHVAALSSIVPASGTGQSFTSAATGVLGYADFAKALGQLDPAFQQNAVWVMSNPILGYVAGLTDTTNGRPLFLPDFGNASLGFAGSILGKPVKVVTQMADTTVATGKVPVYFGDFKSAYVFRQVNPGLGIIRLNERYAPAFQVGFVGFARVGGISKVVGTQRPVLGITIK